MLTYQWSSKGISILTTRLACSASRPFKLVLWIITSIIYFLPGRAGAQEADPILRSYTVELNHIEIFSPSAALTINNVLTDQELKNFNYQTRAAFYADFGNVPSSGWEFSDEFDKISFLKNGVRITAYYDLDFKLVGTI